MPKPDLTPRERQVLQRVVDGDCNKEISRALNISLVTVKLHVSNVLSKLGVADRTQAVKAALPTRHHPPSLNGP